MALLITVIPLLLRFTSAKRHDSVSFLVAFHELEKHMPGLPIKNKKWVDDAHTTVQYWYSGTMGAMALVEVLFGKVNPSGKLATTFPQKQEDTQGAFRILMGSSSRDIRLWEDIEL